MITANFQEKATHSICDDMTCTLYEFNKISILNYKIKSLNKEGVLKFCQFHRAFVENRKENTERKYVFIFDSTDFEMNESQGISDVLSKLREKISLHKSFSDIYEHQLVCSFIIISSQVVKTLLNAIFGVFFTPVRPLKVLQKNDEIESFIRSNANLESVSQTFIDATATQIVK